MFNINILFKLMFLIVLHDFMFLYNQSPSLVYFQLLMMYSVRVTSLDESSEVLVIGGEDHESGRELNTVESRYLKLLSWSNVRFPKMQEVLFRWSGHIIEPIDDVAFIGRNPGDDNNVFIATGGCNVMKRIC